MLWHLTDVDNLRMSALRQPEVRSAALLTQKRHGGVDLITLLRNCLSALCTFEIERGPNSTAREQSESSLATLLGKLCLYFLPAVEFAGVRERNCPSVYFEFSPAHRAPFPICCPGCGCRRTDVDEPCHTRKIQRMFKICPAIQRQLFPSGKFVCQAT